MCDALDEMVTEEEEEERKMLETEKLWERIREVEGEAE